MAQTFYPIDPVDVSPISSGVWHDMDISAYIPSGATGAVLHCICIDLSTGFGLRKNGSTDNRIASLPTSVHNWAVIGVDASRIFEIYADTRQNVSIYLVGYTMSGVTLFTNAYDKSLTDTLAWTDIDCATEAPSAIGLIFEVQGDATTYAMGLRKEGSSDDRRAADFSNHRTFGVIIGCNASQICEGYIGNTAVDFFLVGYITDGCTFNTNATDVSLGTAGSWLDLAALPSNSVMGFIEEIATSYYWDFGLRKDGSAENIYRRGYHSWAFVECDASYIIEGKIEHTTIDFFVVGYATAVAAPPQSISPLAVATPSAIQAPSIKGSGSAPVSLSPIAAPSVIQAPILSGSGVASISLLPVSVVSSVVSGVITQYIQPASVGAGSAVQTPGISGSGAAIIASSPVQASSAVESPLLSGSGSAPISLNPVPASSSVQAPSIAGSGVTAISPTPIQAPSSVQAPSVSGSGAAPITPSSVASVSTIQAPIISTPQLIAPPPVGTSSVVQVPVLAGSGSALITLSIVAAISSVQTPLVTGAGAASIALLPTVAVSVTIAPIIISAVHVGIFHIFGGSRVVRIIEEE